jgi:hypothetical protein
VADFNGDGRDDVAFLAEIDYDMATNARIDDSVTVWTVLSSPNGWQGSRPGLPERVIGDSMEAADLDGDGRPDLAMASNTNDWRRLVSFNRGAEGWVSPLPRGVLANAQHPDVAAHRGAAGTEIFMTFVQFRIVNGANVARTGVIRYSVTPEGIMDKGVPVLRRQSLQRHIPDRGWRPRRRWSDRRGGGAPERRARGLPADPVG